MANKSRKSKNNRKEDNNFSKKHINHDPRTESAKAVFHDPKAKED